MVNENCTSLVNENPILLHIYALDFIQTHGNLEFDTCIFTGVVKYIIFDRDCDRARRQTHRACVPPPSNSSDYVFIGHLSTLTINYSEKCK